MTGFPLFFFVLFGLLAVMSAIMVIVLQNPLSCAFFLIMTFVNLSGLYVLLDAHFIAVAQVLVYAGAIMVLFIFVIMLLNLGFERFALFDRHWSQIPGILIAAITLMGLSGLYWQNHFQMVPVEGIPENFGTVYGVAKLMFTKYLVPFEIIGVLLLVATIGAVVLAKKEI